MSDLRTAIGRFPPQRSFGVIVGLAAIGAAAAGCFSAPEEQPTAQSAPGIEVRRSAQTTTVGGAQYLAECAAQQVPSPPPWGPVNHGQWSDAGFSNFSLTSQSALHVFVWIKTQLPSKGFCVLATRNDGGPTVIDIICQGETGWACYFEGVESTIPSSQSFPNSSVKGGVDLANLDACTNCHAGENAFIAHYGANDALDLTGSSEWMPVQWTTPIVPSGWLQNPGPEQFVGYPPSTSGCLSCHQYNGIAGRFPRMDIPQFSHKYCNILRAATSRPGSMGGMPPGNTCDNTLQHPCASTSDPFVVKMLQHCPSG